jgi:hypothetical protein
VAYQIKITPVGLWHRRRTGNGNQHTACGEPISGAFLSRDWQLDENLCPTCFTPNERDTGELHKIELESLEHAAVDAYGEDLDDEPTDPDAEIEEP